MHITEDDIKLYLNNNYDNILVNGYELYDMLIIHSNSDLVFLAVFLRTNNKNFDKISLDFTETLTLKKKNIIKYIRLHKLNVILNE